MTSAHVLYRALMAFGAGLGRIGITANAMTYASLALAFGAGVAVALDAFVLSALFVVASGACDMLDGVIARATNSVSRFGALLDSTIDRLADGLPLLGLAVFYGTERWIVAFPVAAVIGAFTVSYIRARAEGLGAQLPPLFMRRAERVILLVLSLLLGAVELPGAPVPALLTLLGVSVLAVLNFVGSVVALRAARTALGQPAVSGGATVAAAELRAQP
jgi:phosphatidylglycerophosphate synthase